VEGFQWVNAKSKGRRGNLIRNWNALGKKEKMNIRRKRSV
jgi:hypothetical protein